MDESTDAIDRQLEDAKARHRAGQLAAAVDGYRNVVRSSPGHFEALCLLGIVLMQAGDAAGAIEPLQQADAQRPDVPELMSQLAAALAKVGRNDEAAARFRRAIELAPDYPPAREGYGFLLHAQRRFAAAEVEFAALVRLLPESPAALGNLGSALGELGRFDEAARCYERALALDPVNPVALVNSMSVLERAGRPLDAIANARRLLAAQPDHPTLLYRVAYLFYEQGLREESLQVLDRALAVDPVCAEARWARTMVVLPQAYGPGEEPAEFLRQFDDALAALDRWFDERRGPLGHRAIGETQPYYLVYHDTDNRALMSRHGDLCERLMRASGFAPAPPSRAVASRGPVRLAVVAKFFHDHSVWTALVRGWCLRVDPARAELHLFHTGRIDDAETAVARSTAASFHIGLGDVRAWSAAIRDLRPDAILYPEIGMDAMCSKLAAMRLAPTQMTSWGHPQTSGLATIDHFLSGAAFEPPDGQAHYREHLVALPNLGCYYDLLAPAFAEPDWGSFGLDADVPRLVCAGTPYKYLPRHDHLLVDIARRLGDCHFLFFVDKAPLLSQQVEARLAAAFREGGLDASRFVRFLPRQSRPAFHGLMRAADVYLDTFGFSGFNTAMQAIECELPVVTCEGRFLRGRLASGILRTMGMDELVAAGEPSYVDLAVRLCRDAKYRLDVGGRLAARSGVLLRDDAPVRALEDLLWQARSG